MRSNRPRDQNSTPASVEPDRPEENFLLRWSRRKVEARAPAPKQQEQRLAEDTDRKQEQIAKAAPARAPASEPQPAPPLLPPLEQLNEDSDYSAFMSPEVGDELRRAALRKLFHSPKFNVVDPVDQFVLDWNGFEPLGNVVTHEMQAAMEREAEKLAEQAREKLLRDESPSQEVTATTASSTASNDPPSSQAPADADPRPETEGKRSARAPTVDKPSS